MTVIVKGLKDLQNQFKDIQGKTEKGIEEAMTFILKQSKEEVPVDTGALKKSGKMTKIKNGYEISYKQKSESGYNYAPIQHENLDYKHKKGKAKYLEDPIKQNEQKIIDIVTGRMLE